MTAYVASKGGVIGLTRAIGLELAPLGVCVNSVSPGTVDTAMNRDLFTPAMAEWRSTATWESVANDQLQACA
jgi:NAD(P)-dependent dehydrogenase (short-subunit alcohol dehydrogenase family)